MKSIYFSNRFCCAQVCEVLVLSLLPQGEDGHTLDTLDGFIRASTGQPFTLTPTNQSHVLEYRKYLPTPHREAPRGKDTYRKLY